MKKFKPIVPVILYMDDNMFIDMEYLEHYRKNPRSYWDVTGYEGLVLGFGKNVFVFDVKACDFLVWVRYVGEEPRMEVCEIEEVK